MIGIVYLLVLVALAFGIGAFFLRRLPSESLLERVVFAIALGLGVVSYTILALGLLKLAKTVPLTIGVFVVGLPLAILGYRSLPRREKTKESSAGALGIAVALVMGLCALVTLVGALNPPGELEWDSLSYHLAAPKRYLQEGRIYYIPDDHHSNFPFTLNMLYLWMLSLGSVSGAKLCHWLCGVLLTLAVYTCGTRHFSKAVGQVAAVMVATTPILLWESTTAYIDLALALFSFLSFYAVLNALPPLVPRDPLPITGGGRESNSWLLVSAVLMGWREMTLDVDLKADPEPAGFFEALPRLKDELDINIELASPDQFVPALPGWVERSPFIADHGLLVVGANYSLDTGFVEFLEETL